jgi:hypothetical protein
MARFSRDGMPAQYSSLILLSQFLAGILACGVAGLGQETPGNPRVVNLDDDGLFLITLAGRPLGTEKFRIHSSPGKVEAQGEIRLHIEQNGKKANVQSFPDLVLDSQLHPVTYTWNQKGPQSSRLEVDFRGSLAKVRYMTINGNEDNRDFELPHDVVVLDDNVIHHYQVIIARYQEMGGGKQTLRVFVPQEALPSLLTVEDMGNAATTIDGAMANIRHLQITTDVTHIDLWVDNQQHIERFSVPQAQLEATRKK